METNPPSLADVLKALQDIQVELVQTRQESNTLKVQVQGLVAQNVPLDGTGPSTSAPTNRVPATVIVQPPSSVPLAAPERFTGDPRKYMTFLTQCRLHFLCKPTAFETIQARTAFVISYLTGDAAAWAMPLVQKDDPLLYNWDGFLGEFGRLFDRREVSLAQDKELLALRQGTRDLVSYVTQFNRLVIETDWPENKQTVLFYQGLKEELKDAIAQVEPQPTTCTAMIDLALRLDHRINERKGDKKKPEVTPFARLDRGRGNRSIEEPMQIGGVRGPLSTAEKEQRKVNNLCLYCGQPGHYIRTCPNTPKKGVSGEQNKGESGKGLGRP